MRVVFAGTPETAVPSLEALVASRHDVVAVITRPDAPAGRGRTLTPSPVAVAAAAHGIEVLKPAKPSDPDFMARLRALEPGCCPIVAYGALIRREALDIPEYGWVNLHFSVLPSWRGAAPVQRAIMAGDEVTGATVFSLVEELDAGPTLGTITELIRDDDTTAALLQRLADWGSKLLVDVIDHIEDGDISAIPQPEDNISYAPKLTTEDARIDWNRPAFAIDRHVRGCTPAPGAWTTLAGDRIKIFPLRIADNSTLPPGRIAASKNEVRVGTTTTDVVLGDLQAVGKKRMPAADWARGTTFDDEPEFHVTDPVRMVAFHALRAVDERDAYVNLVLPAMLKDNLIEGRDAAFATELVHGTVRRRGTYDAIIDHVASKGIGSIDPPVLDALRLGTHQLLSMRVPPHAAVSTTVDVVRREIGHKPVHFANALLRKIGQKDLEGWLATVTQGLEGDAERAVRTSHPEWIVHAFREALGGHATQIDKLLAADNVPPRVTLVARPGLSKPEDLPGTPGLLSPYARILEGGAPGDIPEVRDGRAGVQDEGSQLVAITLADAVVEGRDERWLDLCAGPGGKAALLGALANQRGATLVANELQAHRADLVRQGVHLLDNVEVTTFDGRHGPWEPDSFDRVLVDAPCTGLGALRRRPESRWRRSMDDLSTLVPLQTALLTRAVELTRPGGVVAYATCSPHVAETAGVVEAVAAGRDDVDVGSTHQWWPHIDGTDAMFCALLRRH